jgi:hypothetical protein
MNSFIDAIAGHPMAILAVGVVVMFLLMYGFTKTN